MRGEYRLRVFATGSSHTRVARVHPTRTTTKLLLGVACAVSAVSGCVNVTPASVQPAAAPSTPGAAPRHEPRGGPGATPVVVQAPALEALKAMPGQSAGPSPAGGRQSAPRSGAPAADPDTGTAARGTAAGGGSALPVPDIPEPGSRVNTRANRAGARATGGTAATTRTAPGRGRLRFRASWWASCRCGRPTCARWAGGTGAGIRTARRPVSARASTAADPRANPYRDPSYGCCSGNGLGRSPGSAASRRSSRAMAARTPFPYPSSASAPVAARARARWIRAVSGRRSFT